MSLTPPPKVGKLQETLHAQAKRAPNYRFYALYDKVYRADVLWHAYQCCRSNDGAAGVDGQTFADIEAYFYCNLFFLGAPAAVSVVLRGGNALVLWCQ